MLIYFHLSAPAEPTGAAAPCRANKMRRMISFGKGIRENPPSVRIFQKGKPEQLKTYLWVMTLASAIEAVLNDLNA